MSDAPLALPHGCDGMALAIADPRVALRYLPRFREYGIAVVDSSSIQEISHCPFCGEKLPGSLRDEFFDALDELELEIDDPALPARFASDAWWRERDPDGGG